MVKGLHTPETIDRAVDQMTETAKRARRAAEIMRANGIDEIENDFEKSLVQSLQGFDDWTTDLEKRVRRRLMAPPPVPAGRGRSRR